MMNGTASVCTFPSPRGEDARCFWEREGGALVNFIRHLIGRGAIRFSHARYPTERVPQSPFSDRFKVALCEVQRSKRN